MLGKKSGVVIPLIVALADAQVLNIRSSALGVVVLAEMITECNVYWNSVIARNVKG